MIKMFVVLDGIGDLCARIGEKLSPIRKTPRSVSLELTRELQFLFYEKGEIRNA
jgi:hypothetical protein